MDLGRTFPVSNFLKSVTSGFGHCSNDTKEADILDRLGLPLKGVKLGGGGITAICGKIVRCSLNLLSSVDMSAYVSKGEVPLTAVRHTLQDMDMNDQITICRFSRFRDNYADTFFN